ncbi:MAG TPA: DUF1707 domain-containing protein [Streptosporangiaceae bacterium]|nr:DUF1707 domain-containing protein [Streptosporangiaceae bacterium]
MAADPRIRVSDDDRDRAAALLREHHAAGRLDAEEFDERLDRALAAKTTGDIEELLSDLPAIDLYRLPDAGLQRRRGPLPGSSSALAALRDQGGMAQHGRFSPAWRAAWGSWFTVTLVLVVVWAISGFGAPWFLFVAGPWGAILLGRWISGAPQNGPRGGPHRGPRDGRRRPARPGQLPGDHDQLGGAPPG